MQPETAVFTPIVSNFSSSTQVVEVGLMTIIIIFFINFFLPLEYTYWGLIIIITEFRGIIDLYSYINDNTSVLKDGFSLTYFLAVWPLLSIFWTYYRETDFYGHTTAFWDRRSRALSTLRIIFRLDALALSVIATATWLAGWLAGCHTPVLYQNG